MAYVSGIVNFYSKGTLILADLDTSLYALAQQLGGTAWNGSAYAILPGNLDSQNLSSQAAFSNAQKAEPFGVSALAIPATSGEVSVVMCPYPLFQVFGVTLTYSTGGNITGGSLDIWVNGVSAAKLPAPSKPAKFDLSDIFGGWLNNFPWLPTTGDKPSSLPLTPGDVWGTRLDLYQDDVIAIDWAKLSLSGALNNCKLVLWGKTPHVA